LLCFSPGASAARTGVPRTGRQVQANSTILACAVEIGQCAGRELVVPLSKIRIRDSHHGTPFRYAVQAALCDLSSPRRHRWTDAL